MNTPKMSAFILPMLIAALVGAAAPAEAYNYKRCNSKNSVWKSSTKTFLAAPISFPLGSGLQAALDASVDGWNLHSPASQFNFNVLYQDSPSYSLGDGTNSILFTDGYAWDPGALAVARTLRDPCIWPIFNQKIKEVDVLFNPDFVWSTDTNPEPPVAGSPFNLALVSLHELGHAFGLKHENDVMGTMDAFYPGGGPLGNDNDVHPHADDARGVRGGYGTAGVAHDLAASASRRDGAGTSEAIPTRATTFRGIPQAFEFTIENRGTVDQGSLLIEYYLSGNRLITPADTFLGSSTFVVDKGTTATLAANVIVPVALPPGDYFFGYIVDADDQVAETDEGNNAVAHAQATFVTAAEPPNQAPTACFSVTPEFGAAPLGISVDAGCSSDFDGTIVSYEWDFGDGFSGIGETDNHLYVGEGSYQIQLTVTDDDGATGTDFSWVFATCEPNGQPCELEP